MARCVRSSVGLASLRGPAVRRSSLDRQGRKVRGKRSTCWASRASRMRGTACVSKMEQRLLICVMYTADLPHWLCAPHRWATCEIRYVRDVSPPVAAEPDTVVLPSGVSEAPTVLVGSCATWWLFRRGRAATGCTPASIRSSTTCVPSSKQAGEMPGALAHDTFAQVWYRVWAQCKPYE